MTTVRALQDGTIQQLATTPDGSLPFPADPSAVNVILLDETTNAALVADMQATIGSGTYRLPLVAGIPTLQRKTVTVAVSPATALQSLRDVIIAGVPEATLEAAVAALWAGTATSLQQQKAIAFIAAKLRIAGIL